MILTDEIALIKKIVLRVGIKSLLNYGAGSLVYSEGVHGVTQEDLVAYTREIALHCVTVAESVIMSRLADAEIKMPVHPEPHTYCWTKLEIEAITEALQAARANGYAAGARAQLSAEPVCYRIHWPQPGGGHTWIMNSKPMMQKEGFVNQGLYTPKDKQP